MYEYDDGERITFIFYTHTHTSIDTGSLIVSKQVPNEISSYAAIAYRHIADMSAAPATASGDKLTQWCFNVAFYWRRLLHVPCRWVPIGVVKLKQQLSGIHFYLAFKSPTRFKRTYAHVRRERLWVDAWKAR